MVWSGRVVLCAEKERTLKSRRRMRWRDEKKEKCGWGRKLREKARKTTNPSSLVGELKGARHRRTLCNYCPGPCGPTRKTPRLLRGFTVA